MSDDALPAVYARRKGRQRMQPFFLVEQLCDLRSDEEPWDGRHPLAPMPRVTLAVMLEIYVREN